MLAALYLGQGSWSSIAENAYGSTNASFSALPYVIAPSEPRDESKYARDERKVVIELCDRLAPQDLADVLKWPFAVGEAETIVLASLEKKTRKQFAGDVWKFVEQADSLGIKDIELPAKRPRAEDALKELDKLRGGTAHR